MAIRDVNQPQQKPGASPGGAGGLPAPLEKGLKDGGLVTTGQNPRDAASNIANGLVSKGFPTPPALAKADFAIQFAAALKAFQVANGLKGTGQLDGKTAEALKNAGITGQPPQPEDPAKMTKGDGFEQRGASSLLGHGANKRAELVNQSAPDTNFLDALLNKLGPGGPNEGTSASDVHGAAQTQEAKVDAKSQAELKKGESANKKGSTTENAKDPDLSNQQMDKGNAQGVKVMRGLRAEQTKTEEKRRRDSITGKDPTELGILDEEADEDALEGAGDDGDKKGRGGHYDGGGAEEGDPDGTERERGNASSGDEDYANAQRGNAQIGDDELAEGYHRMPTLSEQAQTALTLIKKDASEDNRATTYSWDVTFFKPGVYGPGQAAQELVHLVVEKAAAFDGVWQKAQLNLTAMIKRVDSTGEAPTLEDIMAAIRQARARDGGESGKNLRAPAAPLKVVKPMGRA